jgi:N-acetylglutamate synthase/N-acetylornithine aminotransferase
MSITSGVNGGQGDEFLKDFDYFLQTRVINLDVEKMSPEYNQAYDKFKKLMLEVEKKLGRQAYLDLEAAVNFVVVCVEDAVYKTGFREGARLILQLLKG